MLRNWAAGSTCPPALRESRRWEQRYGRYCCWGCQGCYAAPLPCPVRSVVRVLRLLGSGYPSESPFRKAHPGEGAATEAPQRPIISPFLPAAPCGLRLRPSRHLAPGALVPRIVRIVAWGVVVAGVTNGVGSDALLELFDLELFHVAAFSLSRVSVISRALVAQCGLALPSGFAVPSGFALPDGFCPALHWLPGWPS